MVVGAGGRGGLVVVVRRKERLLTLAGGIAFVLPVGIYSTISGRYPWTGSSTVKRVLWRQLRGSAVRT